jgi:hypothetical protein
VADTLALEQRYRARQTRGLLRRALEPPAPFLTNPREPNDFPLGRWNLYIGGSGRTVAGYVNLDLFPMPGVDIAADAEILPSSGWNATLCWNTWATPSAWPPNSAAFWRPAATYTL